MTEVHFTNLLIVVAVALLAPLALGFFPRIRVPAIVLEIVLGIVIGPSGFGWVKPDLRMTPLSPQGFEEASGPRKLVDPTISSDRVRPSSSP